MKALIVPNGIIHINESKAVCSYCGYKIQINEIDKRWVKTENDHIRMKCACKKFVGITINIMGDFVAYSLTEKVIL